MNKFLWIAFLTAIILGSGCTASTPASVNITEAPAQTAGMPSPSSMPTSTHFPPSATEPAPDIETSVAPPTLIPTVLTVPSDVPAYTCMLEGTDLPVEIFEVINRFPHNPNAYTQGLIFRDGLLYEGTGLYGQSSLRTVELQSGEVTQKTSLPDQYFGEGITELDDRIFQITWQEKTGFIYRLDNFDKIGEFSYATQGWGLTHDDKRLIMSDGSDRLFFLDPQTLAVTGEVAVSDDRGPVHRINELEFIDGQVLANIYQTACIARIDPLSGKVVGWIDISGLYELAVASESETSGAQPVAEVPNGIAYDPESKRLFVTGKFWPALFEIRLHPAKDQP